MSFPFPTTMNTRTLLLALLCAACAFGYVYGLTAYGPAVHKALVPAR
jgi:hypothetical protein